MLRIGCLLVVAVLAIFIAIPVVASRYIPWYATLLLIVAEVALLIFVVPKLGKWIFKRALTGMLGMKSKVLRNATVEVHSLEKVPKPLRRVEPSQAPTDEIQTPEGTVVTGSPTEEANDDDDEKDKPGTRYVRVDCTITPGKTAGPMQLYEPDDIVLVSWDKKVSLRSMEDEDDSNEAAAVEMKIVGEDPDNDSGKYGGPQRIEFVFRCPPELKSRAKFRYYFETFGDLQIPD